jgi:hypothetical protein
MPFYHYINIFLFLLVGTRENNFSICQLETSCIAQNKAEPSKYVISLKWHSRGLGQGID